MRRESRIACLLLYAWVMLFPAGSGLLHASDADATKTKPSHTIAVAALGDKADSEISSVAGKAPYYLIFNENGTFLKSVNNPGLTGGRNSSAAAVDLFLRESTGTVIAGKFGVKMQNRLKMSGISYCEREGNARKTVQALVKNRSGR